MNYKQLCGMAVFVLCCSLVVSSVYSADSRTPLLSTSFSNRSLLVLKSADQNKIEKFHCSEYDLDKTNAQAAFGCFMIKASKMFEGPAITSLLAALSEPPIHVQEDILSSTNSNSICSKFAIPGGSKKFFGEFSKIPFNTSINFADTTPKKFFKEMLKRLKNNNVSFSSIRDDIYALDGSLSELITLLHVPRATAGFTFMIPKETCQVSKNILVRKMDLEGFYSLLGSMKIFANLIGAYDIGLDPQVFVSADGTVNKEAFVKNANGETNGKLFIELKSGAGNLSHLQPFMLGVTKSIIMFVDGVNSSASSDIFGAYMKEHGSEMNKLKKYAMDVKASLSAPSAMTPMIHSSHPDIKINVSKFLSDLPNPESVSDSDPFVLSVGERVKFVAGFFKKLFKDIASY